MAGFGDRRPRRDGAAVLAGGEQCSDAAVEAVMRRRHVPLKPGKKCARLRGVSGHRKQRQAGCDRLSVRDVDSGVNKVLPAERLANVFDDSEAELDGAYRA